MLPKLDESSFRGFMWICTSIVIGVMLAAFGASKGLFRNPDTRLLERVVFVGLWLTTVVGGIAAQGAPRPRRNNVTISQNAK